MSYLSKKGGSGEKLENKVIKSDIIVKESQY